MIKAVAFFFSFLFLLTSCLPFKVLNSTTYIKANSAFILGSNKHGKFYAHITSASSKEITIWQCPIAGGKHSPLILKGLSSAKVVVDKNTSLRFENLNSEEVTVKLKVKGDLGLSMGYKN
jgi:hypothetical protein